ncbi:hypothetical protein [Glutamicibacter uratoxydans]|nr:hypothetical protein [Glutamicibacter uratoxydans]
METVFNLLTKLREPTAVAEFSSQWLAGPQCCNRQAVLLTHEPWQWMTSGFELVLSATPLFGPIIALLAAIYAVRTFKLKVRVDHGDQWLKRFQEGMAKSLSENEVEQEFGAKLLATLNQPVRPWLFFDPDKNRSQGQRRGNREITSRQSVPPRKDQYRLQSKPINNSQIYVRHPGLRPHCQPSTSMTVHPIESPDDSVQFPLTVSGEFNRAGKPIFIARLKAYAAYLKSKMVRWNVSSEEAEMHRAISEKLQRRMLFEFGEGE